MDVSSNGLDLIKRFEGFSLEAYLCPAGVPTIGWGTTRYPDGRAVVLGDAVSEEMAEAFLKFECDKIVDNLNEDLKRVDLNQNQFDALVSFCFNLGVGAFARSTLRQRFLDGDFAAAGKEFLKWNKAKVKGILTELDGLTKRRREERALFEKLDGFGEGLPKAALSPEETVKSARGLRVIDINYVVAYDDKECKGAVVEVLELENRDPRTFIMALEQYPNLVSFDFGRADALPEGPRKSLSGTGRALPVVKAPPWPKGLVLRLGSADEGGATQVSDLQERLKALGYLRGEVDGIFGEITNAAAKQFQEVYFGRAEADGLVGRRTWAKMWGDAPPKLEPKLPSKIDPHAPTEKAGKAYLTLTRTNRKFGYGGYILDLAYFKNGAYVSSIEVCSGVSRKQNFRTGPKSPAKSMEPLPEGVWTIGALWWASGVKHDYDHAVFNDGIGPVKVMLDYVGFTPRTEIRIHIDWNRSLAPGTAGCVGVQSVQDFEKLVEWLDDGQPKKLFVDWGQGTCPRPIP